MMDRGTEGTKLAGKLHSSTGTPMSREARVWRAIHANTPETLEEWLSPSSLSLSLLRYENHSVRILQRGSIADADSNRCQVAGLRIQLHHLALAIAIGIALCECCVQTISGVLRVSKKHKSYTVRSRGRNPARVIYRSCRTIIVIEKCERQYTDGLTSARIINEDQLSVCLAIKHKITGGVDG